MKRKSAGAESHPQKRRQRSRQQCGHCQQFLSNLQYHEHRKLFLDATINEWTNRPCKLAAISWRFVTLKLKKMPSKSPQKLERVRNRGDFSGNKSPRNRR